jgi:hypothetical protein
MHDPFNANQGVSAMKCAQVFLLFLFLGFAPLSAWACSCGNPTLAEKYDLADVIALVDASGIKNGEAIKAKVIRSWKIRLPDRIDVEVTGKARFCAADLAVDGIYIAYIRRSKWGRFSLIPCVRNVHESSPEFQEHIDWLDSRTVSLQRKTGIWAGDCVGVTRLSGLDGQSDAALAERFGAPWRKETFRLGDRQDEFHVAIENHYPMRVAGNADVLLQEWTWEHGKCRLVVWLHRPDAAWVAFDNLRYPVGTEF